ncbi:MAG: Outer membrane usher protein HtrE [Pseudomonas sp.]|nr:MAG: Outer membrane usher protein HtrE [Pseudomonas sp.]
MIKEEHASEGLIVNKSAVKLEAHTPKATDKSQANSSSKRIVFDSQMLMQATGGKSLDTSRFERGEVIEPGHYRLDVVLNNQWRGVERIELGAGPRGARAVLCYDREFLVRIGIDLQKAERGQDDRGNPSLAAGRTCAPLEHYVPGSKVKIDLAEQALSLSVPSYYLTSNTSRTLVDPQSWDQGITAATLNYNANLYDSQTEDRHLTSGYAGLDAGFNLGRLHLRHSGTLTWAQQQGADYQRSSTYLQTDIPAWRSQLLLGEDSTSGEFFDAISFRGIRLNSDERMLPDAMRYYAPVVRGTANSNAKVSVYQRGFLIYEKTVAPGPFALSELQTASYGGDLEVRITEANGEVHGFTVPYATTVQLLRSGTSRYSLMVGQVQDLSLHERPGVVHGVYQHGLANDVTAYGGSAFTESYMSALLGAAFNTRLGGIAADVTVARTSLPEGGGRLRGSSYRVSYNKNLANSGTDFSLTAYRYSTSGYLSLRDAVFLQDRMRQGELQDDLSRLRNRMDVSISQHLWGGSLYFNSSSQRYWNRGGSALNYSIGYSNSWHDISYTLAAQRLRTEQKGDTPADDDTQSSTQITLNISMPLGGEGRRRTTLNSFVSRASDAGTQITTGVSGVLGAQGNSSYSVSASHDRERRTTTENASLDFRLPQTEIGTSLSRGPGYRQLSLSATGGLVAHRGGLTASQALGETIGVIHAPNAKGARVGYSDSRIDGRGYAIIPNLNPYQLNSVDLDPSGISRDVEIKTSTRNVAPHAGAIVQLDYPTEVAHALLIDSRAPGGEPLPFASEVVDIHTGRVVGVVGQGSRLVLRVPERRGALRVQWGRQADQVCRIDYALAERKGAGAVLKRACVPSQGIGAE